MLYWLVDVIAERNPATLGTLVGVITLLVTAVLFVWRFIAF